MKLRKGKRKYGTPAIGLFVSACLSRERDANLRHCICHISTSKMIELESKAKGLPTGQPIYISLLPSGFVLYPVPDQAYELHLRFHPPMEKI